MTKPARIVKSKKEFVLILEYGNITTAIITFVYC